MAEWRTIQSNFVDEPSQAIVDADRLIQEVMQVRAYPVSNFEQQAADLSVNYPEVVSNYRAAHEIAIKNAQKTADTEELRRAMVLYRSLFEDLVGGLARADPGEPGSPGKRPTSPPRTWLLSTGWRRCGLIRVDEVPAAAFR